MSNSREIARLSLDGSALERVLTQAASGEDVGTTLEHLAYAGEDPYASGEADLGADVNTLLSAVQGDEVSGSDFGEDVGDDLGADDLTKGLNQLIQAATAGTNEYGEDLGADEISGARQRLRRAATRVRARQRNARPSASRAPARAAMRSLASNTSNAFRAQGAKMNPFTPAMSRVLERVSPGEGPRCPLPINLVGGLTATIPAGGSVEIPVRPPKDSVLTALCIGSDIAARFAIGPIMCENDNLLGSNGAVPGEMFRPDSRLNGLPNKLVRGGRDIIITVRNLSGADSPFVAAFQVDEGDLLERARRTTGG